MSGVKVGDGCGHKYKENKWEKITYYKKKMKTL